MPNNQLQKRSMRIAGHRTSLAIEPEFWALADELAKWKGSTLPILFAKIDAQREAAKDKPSLASAVRVECLKFALQAPQSLRNKLTHELTQGSVA